MLSGSQQSNESNKSNKSHSNYYIVYKTNDRSQPKESLNTSKSQISNYKIHLKKQSNATCFLLKDVFSGNKSQVSRFFTFFRCSVFGLGQLKAMLRFETATLQLCNTATLQRCAGSVWPADFPSEFISVTAARPLGQIISLNCKCSKLDFNLSLKAAPLQEEKVNKVKLAKFLM